MGNIALLSRSPTTPFPPICLCLLVDLDARTFLSRLCALSPSPQSVHNTAGKIGLYNCDWIFSLWLFNSLHKRVGVKIQDGIWPGFHTVRPSPPASFWLWLSINIVDMDKFHQSICCQDKCHHNSKHLLKVYHMGLPQKFGLNWSTQLRHVMLIQTQGQSLITWWLCLKLIKRAHNGWYHQSKQMAPYSRDKTKCCLTNVTLSMGIFYKCSQ